VKTKTMLAALAMTAVPATALAVPMMYEKEVAMREEARIIRQPIGGIQNSKWYNYRANVNESRKELSSDLRGATDIEDQRDAYEEYGSELRHERKTYVSAMMKRGYRPGPEVYVGE
jgi:hypothetical protein